METVFATGQPKREQFSSVNIPRYGIIVETILIKKKKPSDEEGKNGDEGE